MPLYFGSDWYVPQNVVPYNGNPHKRRKVNERGRIDTGRETKTGTSRTMGKCLPLPTQTLNPHLPCIVTGSGTKTPAKNASCGPPSRAGWGRWLEAAPQECTLRASSISGCPFPRILNWLLVPDIYMPQSSHFRVKVVPYQLLLWP